MVGGYGDPYALSSAVYLSVVTLLTGLFFNFPRHHKVDRHLRAQLVKEAVVFVPSIFLVFLFSVQSRRETVPKLDRL